MTRESPLLLRERPVALTAGLLAVLAALLWIAMAIPDTAATLQWIDERWRNAMAAREWSPLVNVAQVLALVGSAWVTLPLRVLVALWLWRERQWARLGAWLLAVVPAQVLTGIGKPLYGRPRPDDGLMEASTAAFPSGHATNAAVMGLALVFVLVPPGARRRFWLTVAIGYALAMAWSRVYLRVHWLSDVTAGLLAGAAWALFGALLAQRLIASRRPGNPT